MLFLLFFSFPLSAWQPRSYSLLEKKLYIRYGDLPENGRSRNYHSGMLEAGISVYPAKYDFLTGAIIFDDNYGIWQGGTLISVMLRRAYLVEGDYVGDGSDGEPLLRNVRKSALLAYDPGKRGFRIKRRCPKSKL